MPTVPSSEEVVAVRRAYLVVMVWAIARAGGSQDQDLKKAVLNCASIDGSISRLDCYDAMAGSLAERPQPAVPGQWAVKVGKSPLDDSTVVALSLVGTDSRAELTLRCRQAKLEVLLSLRGQIIGATDPVVWTRFGDAKAEKKRWSVSTDNKAVLLPGDARPFIQHLLTVDRLTLQLEHFLRGPITDVFDIGRLKDAITPLSDACPLR
jgi:type VI secretion system protein VasI